MDIGNGDNCPECGGRWKGEDIYQYFLRQKNDPSADQYAYYKGMTDEEIYEVASYYGYTRERPVCFRRIIGVELPYDHPQHYDGVSYWQCPDCDATWNRFTGSREDIPNE